MSTLIFLSLGCIIEAVATPIEKAINRPKFKGYRKPDHKKGSGWNVRA